MLHDTAYREASERGYRHIGVCYIKADSVILEDKKNIVSEIERTLSRQRFHGIVLYGKHIYLLYEEQYTVPRL